MWSTLMRYARSQLPQVIRGQGKALQDRNTSSRQAGRPTKINVLPSRLQQLVSEEQGGQMGGDKGLIHWPQQKR